MVEVVTWESKGKAGRGRMEESVHMLAMDPQTARRIHHRHQGDERCACVRSPVDVLYPSSVPDPANKRPSAPSGTPNLETPLSQLARLPRLLVPRRVSISSGPLCAGCAFICCAHAFTTLTTCSSWAHARLLGAHSGLPSAAGIQAGWHHVVRSAQARRPCCSSLDVFPKADEPPT